MGTPDAYPPRNYLRRAIGIAVCLALPLGFAVSLTVGLLDPPPTGVFAAWGLLVPAACLSFINAFLAIGRPLLYRIRHGTYEGCPFVSGFALIGDLCLLVALIHGWASPGTAAIGLVLCFTDLNGIAWFLFATWSDRSMWDARRGDPESPRSSDERGAGPTRP